MFNFWMDFTSTNWFVAAIIAVIAILDSIQLALAAVTASHVPAMLTVTLIQLSIPLSVCFSHLSRNSRNGYDSSTENAECNINVGNNACRNVVGGDVVQSIDVSIDSASEQIRDANAHRRSLSDGRRYPASYILGVIIVSISVFVGLLPEILSVRHSSLLPLDSTMSSDVSWNSILYTASTIPLAGSTIVKEKTLSENRQPIERNQVNLVLALGQFIFVAVVSPLFYGLQGMAMGPEWLSLYPSRDITMNFIDGVSCFAGMRDKSALSTKYVERASCGWITTALILGHVLSISLVGFAVHGLVVHVQSSAESKSNTFQEGILTAPLAGPVSELNDDVGRATTVLYRGIAIGIVISVMVLSYYDIVASSNTYGTLTNIFFWSSVVLLIIGWELYHRSGLIEEAFDTEYPQLEVDDDDDE